MGRYIQMGKIQQTKTPPRKRVAAYARVSLETDRLAHSMTAQSEYYGTFIRDHGDWINAGIYADSFLSGTETDHRAEFTRLITDCEQGKIDIVLCKSISRFARNTVDLLRTIRRLNELGINVYFEKENISTLSGDGELLLTILASFAQEESRSVSENVKWGIRKRFRLGNAAVRNKTVFGYRFINGRYEINAGEAELVRLIFELYISGVSLRNISEKLKISGVKTPRGYDFSHNQIDYIVHNEIYIGNIVFQKTFVKDFITHTKVPNQGELPMYRLYNCHDPIIDEETFAKAQAESERRASKASKKQNYPFSGRLICSKCGKPFTRRSNNGKYACWHCRSCVNSKLNEDKLTDLFGIEDDRFPDDISAVSVNENGELDITFYDGRTEKWQYK